MVEVVLFHHVLGVSDGIVALGDDLTAAGHSVSIPDLFEGQRFDTIEQGAAHVDELGVPTIIERAASAVIDRPGSVVYIGVSLGVIPAQYLVATRPGARGAVLLEACLPAEEFGGSWPDQVPVQIHGMTDDPFFAGEGDVDNARHLVASTADAELFTYTGDRHLFTDRSLPAHDGPAADLVLQRTLDFLARIT